MKKLKMARAVTFTFEEGCNKHLENCRQRNLREGARDVLFVFPLCVVKFSPLRAADYSHTVIRFSPTASIENGPGITSCVRILPR